MMGVLLNVNSTAEQRRQALKENDIPISLTLKEGVQKMSTLEEALRAECREEGREEERARSDAQRNESMWKLWKQGICSKAQLQDAFGLSASAVDAILAQQPTVELRPAS